MDNRTRIKIMRKGRAYGKPISAASKSAEAIYSGGAPASKRSTNNTQSNMPSLEEFIKYVSRYYPWVSPQISRNVYLWIVRHIRRA